MAKYPLHHEDHQDSIMLDLNMQKFHTHVIYRHEQILARKVELGSKCDWCADSKGGYPEYYHNVNAG